jgi:protein SCO1/2
MRRLLLLLVLSLAFQTTPPLSAAQTIGDFGSVGDFALTERSGRTVTNSDLRGKVWIASFLFTRCTSGCPQVSATIKQLQSDLARYPDVLFVTFTVDPEHDDPAELSRYADHFEADPQRWLFLTGKQERIYELLEKSFHLPAKQNEGEERKPGAEVTHSSKLVVVDRQGHLRGYFEGMRDARSPDPDADYQANMKKLKTTVVGLAYEEWYLPSDFPRFNAGLNALCVILLLLGYAAIRGRLIRLHAACMLTALCVSALFLTSYLYYHLVIKQGQPTSFAEQTSHANPPPGVAIAYLGILLSHTLLAVIVAPLALYTAYQALRGRLLRHIRVARWTLPLWLYVSITGVVVYWMLYRLYPPS